jgi:hypothetical protein
MYWLLEENETLRKEKRERENLEALAADLEFRPEDRFYIRKSEKSPKLVPYCPLCWDKERKLVHLPEGASLGVCASPSDGSSYWTAEFRNRSSGPRWGVPLERA